MKFSRLTLRSILAVTLLFGLIASSRAQSLAADYQVQGVYTSSVGTIGPLTVVGPTAGVTFTSDTVNGNTQQVLHLATDTSSPFAESGVQTQTAGFLSSSNYSVVLLASFNFDPTNILATKIFDFKNLSSDAGLYVNDATGDLQFIDGSGVIQGFGGLSLTSNSYVQLALTRDAATNLTSIYLNGTLAFSFTDSTGLATLGDSTASGNAFLTLFKDDGAGLGAGVVDETTQGNIARLRLYDGVLSAAQIAGLDTTIPEPSTWALFGAGLMLLLVGWRHRRTAA